MVLHSIKNQCLKKYGIIILVVFIALILSPIHTAHAQLGSWAQSSITQVVASLAVIAKGAIAGLIGITGSAIDKVLGIPATGSGVVEESWEIVRGFANMFFIIALIIMAFATIFDVGGLQKYNFSSLIARFLVAVLLINFSLVIGELIIDWSQSLANVFKESIGDIGNRIAQGATFGAQFQPPAGGASIIASTEDLSVWNATLDALGSIIMLSIILFSMVVMLFFVIIRIPILWALLIFSPIAWITYILPTTQKVNKMWWNYFISWNLFLPIYLFFIYFGAYFLSRKNEILSNGSAPLVQGYGMTLDIIFFYLLVALFLIGGAKLAISYAGAGGAGAVAGAIRTKAWGTARFAGVGLIRRTPGLNMVEPAYKAAGQRITQFQKDSEEALKGRQSVWAERFGVKGEGVKAQQVFTNKANKTFDDLKQKIELGQLKLEDVQKRAGSGKATDAETYAYRKILAERGQLGENLYAQTFQDLVNNPYASQDFAKAAKDNMKAGEILKMVTSQGNYAKGGTYDMSRANFTPAKKELLKAITADPKKISEISQDQYGVDLELLGGRNTAEGKALIKAVSDIRPDFIIDKQFEIDPATGKYRDENLINDIRSRPDYEDIRNDSSMTQQQKDQEIKVRMYENAIKSPKDTADYDMSIWKKAEFQRALRAKILRLQARNQRAAREYISNMDREITSSRNRVQKEMIFDAILGRTSSQGATPPPTTPPAQPPPITPPPPTPPSPTTPPPITPVLPKPTPASVPPRPSGGGNEAMPEFQSTRPVTPPISTDKPTIIGAPPKPESKKPDAVIEIVRDEKGTWRQVKEGETFGSGREFRMDLKTNKNYVKLTEDEIKKLNQK